MVDQRKSLSTEIALSSGTYSKDPPLAFPSQPTLREIHGRDRSDYVVLSTDDLPSASYDEQEQDRLIEASNDTKNAKPQTSPLEEAALVVAA